MGQERLNDFALMSMECEEFEAINWDERINNFPRAKSDINNWKNLSINENVKIWP